MTQVQDPPALLKSTEARAILGLSVTSFERLVDAGALQPVRLPGLGLPRWRRADVEALIAGTDAEGSSP